MTVELEKPARASVGFRIWKSSRARSAQRATMSDLNRPLTKSAAEIKSITTVTNIFLFQKNYKDKQSIVNKPFKYFVNKKISTEGIKKPQKITFIGKFILHLSLYRKAIVSSAADL